MYYSILPNRPMPKYGKQSQTKPNHVYNDPRLQCSTLYYTTLLGNQNISGISDKIE